MKFPAFILVFGLSIANAADIDSWEAFEVGKVGALTVRLRVKAKATLADESWIAIEFENSGSEDIELESPQYHTRAIRQSLESGATLTGSLSRGNSHDMFPNGSVIKPGIHRIVDQPSLYSSAMLGLPKSGAMLVKAEFDMDMRMESSLIRFKNRNFEFEWHDPKEADFDQMRRRLRHLLANPENRVEHAYILNALLKVPEVAKAPTAEEVLAAITPRTESFSGREYVLEHLNKNFATEKFVVDSFEARLRRGDKNITRDLRRVSNIWRPEFLPLLVDRFEANPSEMSDIYVLLRLHGNPQKTDAKLAQRLSNAMRGRLPSGINEQSAASVANTLRLVGKTYDRKMVSLLAPFLDDRRSTLAPRAVGRARALFRQSCHRVCDDALEAILTILDGSSESAYKRVGLGFKDIGPRKTAEQTATLRNAMITALKLRLETR